MIWFVPTQVNAQKHSSALSSTKYALPQENNLNVVDLVKNPDAKSKTSK
jgi:hypothetical protein